MLKCNKLKKFAELWYLSFNDNLVYTDELTGAKSRYYCNKILNNRYDNKEAFIAFIDIDNLKMINDKEGHDAGSAVIKKVVDQLNLLNLKEICRIGGDEFIIIADKSFDNHLLDSVENISYGYVIKKPNEKLSDAINKADKYMYRRKNKKHKKSDRKSK